MTTLFGPWYQCARIGLVSALLLCAFTAAAEDPSQAAAKTTIESIGNKRFVGPMGVVGDPNPTEDVFIFKDGTFVSNSCLEWGFSPATYWVQKRADGLHFLAELTSPDHGKMRYQGVYDGSQIKGNVMWKKERWYWTIEREYRFTGRLSGQKQ